MMNKIKRLLSILVLSFSIMICALPAYADKIEDAKEEKQSLEEKKQELDERINKLEMDKDDIITYIKKLDKELDNVRTKIEDLSIQQEEVKTSLKVTKQELEEAKEKEYTQYEQMKERIQYIYENGDTAYMEVLFNATSIVDLLNKAEYITDIAEYDKNMLDRLKETRQQIDNSKKQLEKQQAELEELSEELELEEEALDTLVENKNKQLEKYKEKIKKSKELSKQYKKQIKQQEEEIERLEEEARKAEEEARKAKEAASNTTYSGGKFLWPCPSSYRITSNFGYRTHPILGTKRLHAGIDIGASTGASVLAVADGTVVIATYSSSAGNYIMINHGSGVFTVYMHNSKLLVSTGQRVTQGQQIAQVGSTGLSTGSHLHFGVRVNGSYVNPSQYLN